MKWKNRLTNYNFWISIVSAVLLILQAFEINFDIAYINEIATAVLGLLVVIGIISDPTKSSTNNNTVKEVKPEQVETVPTAEEKRIEEKVIEDKETPAVEEQIIPIDAEDENDNIDIQDDFKVLVAEIRKDIEAMTEKMSNLKLEVKSETLVEHIPTIPEVEMPITPVVDETTTGTEDTLIQTSYSIVN